MTATEHHDIVVIGTGFSGLGAAIKLKEAGHEDFVVLERADDVGGTWRENHYPGCACDVPSPLYSFSFAPNPDWSHMFARQAEIRDYIRDCAERFGVMDRIRFRADATDAHWDEEGQRWRLALANGDEVTGRLVLIGPGGLTEPAFPEIEGLEDFGGALMHSAAWDHGVELRGKRIGVIGTGASAIQIVPEVAKDAAHLDVFQRTPAWVAPRLDRRFSRFEKWLFRRFPITQRALRSADFAFSQMVEFGIVRHPRAMVVLEAIVRAQLRRRVRDPVTRRRLTPSYRAGCKRILVSNDFYPAFNRPNVELVTDGIQRVTEDGVLTRDGKLHELDVLVCATGFDIPQALSRVSITGRDGHELAEEWSRGFKAHKGTMVPGFPNAMFISGPNTGTGSTSQVFMIEQQIGYALQALRAMEERGAAVIEVDRGVYTAYNEWIDREMRPTVWLTGGCQSWYLDATGRSSILFPGFSAQFRQMMRRFREDEHHFTAPVPDTPVAGPAPEPATV